MRLGLGIGLQFGHRSGGAAQGPSNTVAPAVTGTAERGELLTCSTGTWTGTAPITYAYQWRRNSAPIAGATSNTYTLVVEDDNATITCIVTATDDTGSRAASSNAVGPVLGAPFNLAAPVLTGTETVGQTLSVTTGTWQGIATITFAYQWRRDGSNISGATSSTYTLVAADYDAVIDCVVTATNSLDSASADSNDTGAIAGLAPTNDVAPSISGNTGLGDVLTRVAGTWSGVPTPTLSGQWRRDGVAISGETGATYTIVAADSGAVIDYLETATNAAGSASADSNNITVQTFTVPSNDVAPSISGNTGLGDTLTRTAGTWSGNPTPVLTGQWRRNGTPISGETGTTYTIAVADSGADIDYLETATNAIGSASADSNDITAQTFAAPTIGAGLSIAGTEEVGETLTATAAAVTGNPTPVRTWQWQRSADGLTGWADISGATSSTYVLDAADENNYVRVKQIETNALGSDEAVSAATGEIQAGAATGILDSYTGAAFAAALDVLIYSAHSITDNAVGSATEGQTGQYTVRVRRSSDNAVSSFTYTEVSDGTLTTWVGAGNDGFLEAWYEQGTNGNHATQATAANQPKIVDAGNLVVENGKAALDFDGVNDFLQSIASFWNNLSTGTSGFIVTQFNTDVSVIFSLGTETSEEMDWLQSPAFVFGNMQFRGASIREEFTGIATGSLKLLSNIDFVGGGAWINSTSGTALIPQNNATPDRITIASRRDGTQLNHQGKYQFIVIFSSNESTNRTDIETAINTEYSIY